MLLRFFQKRLTFHNIPLMLGITAQDDENVVYSKQIEAEENNGKSRKGPMLCVLCSSPGRDEQGAPVGGPNLMAPWSRSGPGFTEGIGSHRDSSHPSWPGWFSGVTVAPASPCNITFPTLKREKMSLNNLPKFSEQSQD